MLHKSRVVSTHRKNCESGVYIYIYIQGVPGGKDLTSGECSLGQTITI